MKHWIAYGCFLALICGIPQAAHAAWKQEVLVTTPIFEPLIAELMEGVGEAKPLPHALKTAHQSSYTPEQVKAIMGAEVIVALDKNLSPRLGKLLAQASDKGALVIYLTDIEAIDALPYRKENPFLGEDQHHTKHRHKQKSVDPHFWLDPLRVANMLPTLAANIADYWPESEAALQHNATRMALHLRAEVHIEIQNILAAAKQRQSDSSKAIPVMTYHDSYQYFEQRYGLESGYITQRPEEYQGAKTTHRLLEKANTTHVRCLLSETRNEHAKRIAALAQASIITLNPERPYDTGEVPHAPWLKNGYDRMLMAVTKAYASCL